MTLGGIGSCYASLAFHLIAFYPWSGHEDRSCNTLFNCLPFEEEKAYWDKASSLILLTSEYNVREYVETPKNFWFEFIQSEQKKKRNTRCCPEPVVT